MVEWQTHYTQNVAPQGVWVQVPPSVPIQSKTIMKTKLEINGTCGTVSLEIDRDFSSKEWDFLTSTLRALVSGESFRVGTPGEDDVAEPQYMYRIRFGEQIKEKLSAIKTIRQELGFLDMGLKDAKDLVEGTKICPWLHKFNYENLAVQLNRAGVFNFTVEKTPHPVYE